MKDKTIRIYNSFFKRVRRVLPFRRISTYTRWSDFYPRMITIFAFLLVNLNKFYLNLNYLTKKVYSQEQRLHNVFYLTVITLLRGFDIKVTSILANVADYLLPLLPLLLSIQLSVIKASNICFLLVILSIFRICPRFFLSDSLFLLPFFSCTPKTLALETFALIFEVFLFLFCLLVNLDL